MSGERMTAVSARIAARGDGPTTYTLKAVLEAAADALAAWEAEAGARAGMPELRYPWGCLNSEGVFTAQASCDDAVRLARNFHRPARPYRAVRLAVVEVAEPEPPRPVREQGVSGWWYERTEVDGKPWVLVWDADEGDKVAEECSSRGIYIPPADRALVARLLGEVAP